MSGHGLLQKHFHLTPPVGTDCQVTHILNPKVFSPWSLWSSSYMFSPFCLSFPSVSFLWPVFGSHIIPPPSGINAIFRPFHEFLILMTSINSIIKNF